MHQALSKSTMYNSLCTMHQALWWTPLQVSDHSRRCSSRARSSRPSWGRLEWATSVITTSVISSYLIFSEYWKYPVHQETRHYVTSHPKFPRNFKVQRKRERERYFWSIQLCKIFLKVSSLALYWTLYNISKSYISQSSFPMNTNGDIKANSFIAANSEKGRIWIRHW